MPGTTALTIRSSRTQCQAFGLPLRRLAPTLCELIMQLYRVKRGRTFGAFNLDAYQIYVCELLRTNKPSSFGISVQHCSAPGEMPFVLSREQAFGFASFIESLPNTDFPAKHKISGGLTSYFTNLYLSFQDRSDSSFAGRIASGNFLGARFNSVTVPKESLSGLAKIIREMYKSA